MGDVFSERGSALVEALVAAAFFSGAVVAVVQLAALAVGIYADAGETSRSADAAEAGLRALATARGTLSPGGNLDADVPGYSDEPDGPGAAAGGVRRRWRVSPGPVPGTQHVVVRVINPRIRRGRQALDVETLLSVELGP
ncbi:MAG: hypothetical protein AB7I25_02445 [Vicinamibacterales bacterium]